MTASHTFRRLFLATMFASMAVVLAWAGWIGWREWPRWRAVREMRAAVEANEPGRFLDAIEQVDSLGVAEAAAEEIAPLRQHPDPRVRMYAVMARTVLGPRGPNEAKELIELFDDPDEDTDMRCIASNCLVLFDETVVLNFLASMKAMENTNDPLHVPVTEMFKRLAGGVHLVPPPPRNEPRREMVNYLLMMLDPVAGFPK